MEAINVPAPAGAANAPERGADPFRAGLHRMWAAVADAWGEHAEGIDTSRAAVSARMLALAAPVAEDRVLELACGPGGLGLAAAALAPHGEVVLSDVAPEMTAVAAARAKALGLANVRTRELDLEQIDEPDGSYDVVLCRDGLMFATDHGRATREIQRVLRPGGRVSIAVWGPRERNPWLGLVFDAVEAQLGASLPPPGVPGPFALADADGLAQLLTDAGLTDVHIEGIEVPNRFGSFEEWWNRTSALAGPLATIVASLPPEARAAIRDRLRDEVAPSRTSSELVLPGFALVAVARHDEP